MPSTTFRFVQKVIEAGGLLPTIRFKYEDIESDNLVIKVTNQLIDQAVNKTIEAKLSQGSLILNFEGKRIWDTSIIDFKHNHAQSMIVEVAKALDMKPVYSGFDICSMTRTRGRDGSNVHWIKVKLWTPLHMNETKSPNMVRDVMVIEPIMTLDAFYGIVRLLLHTNSNTISIDDLRNNLGMYQFMRYEWGYLPEFSGNRERTDTINKMFEKEVRSFVYNHM